MPVTVSPHPSDCELRVTARPIVNAPVIDGANMRFTSTQIGLSGFATLLGSPGDSAMGFNVGFIQAQYVETNWCSYRGAASANGSILVQRGRAPARSQRACRDCVDGTSVTSIFYNTNVAFGEIAPGNRGQPFPQVLRVRHFDQPAETCPLRLRNTLTGQMNLLHEAQLEFLFCALLSVKDPFARFRHLMGVYWNTRWQYTFQQPGFRPIINPAGTGSTVGTPFRGDPSDLRFASVLTSPAETKSCNDIFRAAAGAFNPGSPNRHESRVWTDFSVTVP